jgi:hypothetical protein
MRSQAHATTYLGPASKHSHTHQLLLNDTKTIIMCDVIFQENIFSKHVTSTTTLPVPVAAQCLVKAPRWKSFSCLHIFVFCW